MSRDDCFTTQLIDKNGEFNAPGMENFARKIKLAECGLNYAVVAIMGPQSSGMFLEVVLVESFCIFVCCWTWDQFSTISIHLTFGCLIWILFF